MANVADKLAGLVVLWPYCRGGRPNVAQVLGRRRDGVAGPPRQRISIHPLQRPWLPFRLGCHSLSDCFIDLRSWRGFPPGVVGRRWRGREGLIFVQRKRK